MIRGQQQQLSDVQARVAGRDQSLASPLVPVGLISTLSKGAGAILQGGTVQRNTQKIPVIGDELSSGLNTIGNAANKVGEKIDSALTSVGNALGFGDEGGNPNQRFIDEANAYITRLQQYAPEERLDRYYYITQPGKAKKEYPDMPEYADRQKNTELQNSATAGMTPAELEALRKFQAFFSSGGGLNQREKATPDAPGAQWVAVDPYVVPKLQQDLLAAQKASAEEQQQLAQQRIFEQAAAAQQFAESRPQQQSLGARLGATSLFSDDLHQQMLARNR
jgi:hypothetical protein